MRERSKCQGLSKQNTLAIREIKRNKQRKIEIKRKDSEKALSAEGRWSRMTKRLLPLAIAGEKTFSLYCSENSRKD